VASALRATVGFDVRDLRVGPCSGDFIEYDCRTIDAAVDQQYQQCNKPWSEEAFHLSRVLSATR